MRTVRISLLAVFMLGAVACGEREPAPPPEAAAAPPAADSAAAEADTLRGDSVMARDTARVPQ